MIIFFWAFAGSLLCANGAFGDALSDSEGNCVITGCNRELCADKAQDMVSICITLPEHQCYAHATCERQRGVCAWNKAPAFHTCVKKLQRKTSTKPSRKKTGLSTPQGN